MKTILRRSAAAVLAAALSAGTANAAVTINFAQVGSDVIATASGTLDLTGLDIIDTFTLNASVSPSRAYIGFGNENELVTGYSGFTGPASIGPNDDFVPSTFSTGDLFAFNGSAFGEPYVFVDPSFVSGGTVSSSATFAGQSFASLGLTAGTYVYTSAADTVTFNIGAGAVPEPASWAMMIGGMGLAGGVLRRRKGATKIAFA